MVLRAPESVLAFIGKENEAQRERSILPDVAQEGLELSPGPCRLLPDAGCAHLSCPGGAQVAHMSSCRCRGDWFTAAPSVPQPPIPHPRLSCGLEPIGGQTAMRCHLHLSQQQSEMAAGGVSGPDPAVTRRGPVSSPGPAPAPSCMAPHWTPRQEHLSLCPLLL